MSISNREKLNRPYKHWEVWGGQLLCGFCAGVGSHLGGEYFGHPLLFASVGGGFGGLCFSRISSYIDRRYYSEST